MSEMLLQKPSGCSSPPGTSTATCPVPAPAGRSPEQQRVRQHQAAPHELAEPPLPAPRHLGQPGAPRSQPAPLSWGPAAITGLAVQSRV